MFPSMDERINKMWCMRTMEYYLAIKRMMCRFTLQHTQMKLDVIVLSKRS